MTNEIHHGNNTYFPVQDDSARRARSRAKETAEEAEEGRREFLKPSDRRTTALNRNRRRAPRGLKKGGSSLEWQRTISTGEVLNKAQPRFTTRRRHTTGAVGRRTCTARQLVLVACLRWMLLPEMNLFRGVEAPF